ADERGDRAVERAARHAALGAAARSRRDDPQLERGAALAAERRARLLEDRIGRLELEKRAFDLRDCVESAVDLLAPSAAAKGIVLLHAIGREVPEVVTADAPRIRQVLVNLIGNAIKFTDHGEVDLAVSARPVSDGAAPATPLWEIRF